MKSIRIIPRLDIKGPNLVKGIHLEGLRVLGKPEDFAYKYYLDGADELIYMDVVASLYGRNSLLDIVRRTADKTFIPLTVGGGIRSIDDIRNALRAGADKVAINTAAIKNPQFISEAARTFGSQCIVVSIEAIKKGPMSYEAFTDNGREKTGMDVFLWAQKVCELGAGEILITSINQEGTGKGYDIELVKEICGLVSIPVIALGGAGRFEHCKELVQKTSVDAISLASMFHYNRITNLVSKDSFQGEGNTEFLKSQATFGASRFDSLNCRELKSKLSQDFVNVCNAETREIIQENVQIPLIANPSFKVTIVDYGLGNIFSMARAIKQIGADVEITGDPQKIENAGLIILPGVGAFGDGMEKLDDLNLIEALNKCVKKGNNLLGICLGMQLLMTKGEEFGVFDGLNFISGNVRRIQILESDKKEFKIPHVGWNKIFNHHRANQTWENTLLSETKEGTPMYFVHSNVVDPHNITNCLAVTTYGETTFCSVIRKDNVMGCQFHPEMSGLEGLQIYKSFISCGR